MFSKSNAIDRDGWNDVVDVGVYIKQKLISQTFYYIDHLSFRQL